MSERRDAIAEPAAGRESLGRPAGEGILELLARGGPREVLARIVPGDPLALRPRAARRARARALVVDPERAALRAMALVALRAVRYRGRPRPEAWLDARVDEALDELVLEERDGRPSPAVEAWTRRLGLAPDAVARGLARFHHLPAEDREAFVRLVLEALPLDEAARAVGCGAAELARRARRGLSAFTRPEPREVTP